MVGYVRTEDGAVGAKLLELWTCSTTGIPSTRAAAEDIWFRTTIDFRSQTFVAHSANARVLKSANYCLRAGDATGNGAMNYTSAGNDHDPILIDVGSTKPTATVPNFYDRRDTNLDGVIKYTGTANHRDIILTNVGSTAPNNTRAQQLP